MDALRYFLRHHPVALGLLVLAVGNMLFMSGRFISNAVYFNDPAHREQPLEPWMTPHYVAMSWGLPHEVMVSLLQLMPEDRPPPTMATIAARLGISLDELEIRVENAKAALEAERAARRDGRAPP